MHAYVRHLETLTDDDGRRLLAASSVARAVVSVRSFHRFCAREGFVARDPSEEVGAPPVPAGIPKALDEDEVDLLLQRGHRRRSARAARPGAARAALRHRDPHQRGGRARPRRPRSRRRHACVCSARGRRNGSSRSGRGARVALEAYLRDGRLVLRRARARRSTRDGDAVVLNARGGRHLAPVVLDDRAPGGGAGRARRAAVAARAAPLVCDPHARPRRRSPGGAGAARPRQHLDHPGVHEGLAGAAARRVRRRASPCRTPRRTGPERVRPPGGKGRSRGSIRAWPRRPMRAGAPSSRPSASGSAASCERLGVDRSSYDEGFADSGQVTAERGEVDALVGLAARHAARDRRRARQARGRHLRAVRVVRRRHRRGPPRSDAGGAALHGVRVEAPLTPAFTHPRARRQRHRHLLRRADRRDHPARDQPRRRREPAR